MRAIPVGTRIRRDHLTGEVVSHLARADQVQMIRWDNVEGWARYEWWTPELIRQHIARGESAPGAELTEE